MDKGENDKSCFTFLRLLTRDQQTKCAREGFHNISGRSPHSPRCGIRIFLIQNNFDFPQFVGHGAWSIHTFFIPAQSLDMWFVQEMSKSRWAPPGPSCKPGTFLQPHGCLPGSTLFIRRSHVIHVLHCRHCWELLVFSLVIFPPETPLASPG